MKDFMIYAACIYILGISLTTFAVYGLDKHKSIKNQWRISEKTLILLAALGGSPGALAGMIFFHHKTRKIKFKVGIPAILLGQIAVILFIRNIFHISL